MLEETTLFVVSPLYEDDFPTKYCYGWETATTVAEMLVKHGKPVVMKKITITTGV